MNDTKNVNNKNICDCMYNKDIYTDEVYCCLRIFSGHKFDRYSFAKFQLCRLNVVPWTNECYLYYC